jgi:hypothetical protein
MGGSASAPEITPNVLENVCTYKKDDFNNKIEILKDAHALVQYYASLLLAEKMPMNLEYRNYNPTSEDYFNTKRKMEMGDLQAANPKIRNYYDFYNGLNNLQVEYERNDITENERRNKIKDVFNVSYIVLKLLVEDLWESCDLQNKAPPPEPLPEPLPESESEQSV